MNSAASETPDRSGAEKASLLIVDDEPDTLEAVSDLFKAEGYDVRIAGNGREALDLLRQGRRPCLILLDLRMPEMDGWQFCEALRESPEHDRIPIAIVTASAAVDRLPSRSVDAGMFVKPVDFPRLLRTVKRFCSTQVDRVSSEDALRRSYETLSRALEAARMGYWTWDVETGKVSWSDNLEAMHGLEKGEFAGTFEAFLSLVHPEDRQRVMDAIERTARGEGDYDVDFRVPRKDGTVHWMNGRGHAEIRDGKVVRMIGFGIDVTQRRTVLAAERRLAAIVESSEDAIIAIDLRGRIESWNAAAERMFGWTSDEAIGKSIQMLLPASRSDDFFAEVERITRGEHIAHYETLRQRRDGTILDVALSVSPLRDVAGSIVGASKIVRDITAEKAAARDRERTRELFLASLGHDLRNPLQTIAASSYALGLLLPDAAEKSVGRIQSSALRMGRMIDQLLDFTRARLGGGIPVRPERSDLRQICASVLEEIEALHPNRTRLVGGGACEGLWDGDRLAQVVSNLVGNALDHGSPADPVFVYVRPEDGTVQLEVVNSGTPIAPELLPRLFDPFRRGSHEPHGPRQGLGLGLFITQEIVRAHGGTVQIESSPDGTKVQVTLPVRGSAPAN